MKAIKDNYKGKKVSVMGFGRSGKACANLLLDIGAKVFVSDHSENTNHEHGPRTRIKFEFGKHSERVLDADMIVISPGISLQHPIILKAKERDIPVIGELEFASRFIENQIIGITGTNGKTTTAFLVQKMLESAKIDTVLCGNMGIPLSSVVARLKPSTVPILEVSTFQLETVETFRPWIGILLNITPDHLDRHKSFKEYRDLKLKLFSNQTEDDFAILNFDDPVVRIANTRAQKLFFGCRSEVASPTQTTLWIKDSDIFWNHDKLFSINELNLKWECLLPDYLAAILVGKILKLSSSLILEGLNSFTGVPHRLEDIGTIEKVRFINNSMCTNPEAFMSTLHSFKQPVILIAGGKEKKVDITPIVQAINECTKYTVLIGETAPKLSSLLNTQHCSANSMEEAVKLAYAHASPGDTVLLSPGFASFDWFRDFSERGEKFKEAVGKLTDK